MKRLRNAAVLGFLGMGTLIFASDHPRTLYVVNESAETLSKMDMTTFAVAQNIVAVGQAPNYIAVHNGLLYVVNSYTDDVMVIDPENDGSVLKTIALPEGSNPWMIAFPGPDKAYVTNWVAGTVSILDLNTGTVTGSIPVGTAPEGILVHEGLAYVTNTGYAGWGMPFEPSTVSVIDPAADAVTHTVSVPVNPRELAVDPAGRLHVVCAGDYAAVNGCVAILDLHSGPSQDVPAVVDTVKFNWALPGVMTFQPADLAITAGGKGYCTAWGDGSYGYLCAYDAGTGVVLRDADNPFLIGPNVFQLCYDETGDNLWIPSMTVWGGDGHIQEFDTVEDTVVYVSDVLGNGTKSAVILEAFSAVSETRETPAGFRLVNNFPNPFNPETTVRYELDRAGEMELAVYNTLGQRVRTLVAGFMAAGAHTSVWDGRDDSGRDAAGGLYFCRLQSGGRASAVKMTLLR